MKSSIKHYSGKIYSKEAILSAIHDYKRLTTIKLTINDEYYTCEFTDCKYDSKRIIAEFDNYLIELLNSHGATNKI